MYPTEMPDTPQRFQINTNTGVSLGIIVLGFAGFFAIMNVLNSMKSEIVAARTDNSTLKLELTGKIDKIDARLIVLEANKTSVTATEFFKWAVHLQQANPQIKVPEPEVNTK
jgi:amino acid permease